MASRKKNIRIAVIIPIVFEKRANNYTELITSLKSSLFSRPIPLTLNFIVYVNWLKGSNNNIRNRYKLLTINKQQIKIYFDQANAGFTGAVNNSIEYARKQFNPDWYLILNDDTLALKNFFVQFYPYLKKDNIEVLSCGVLSLDKTIQSIGLEYYRNGISLCRVKKKPNLRQPLYCGACVMYSKKIVSELLEKYHYILNPLYFIYADDLELSLRLLHMGKKIVILPKFLIVHKGSQTVGYLSYQQMFFSFRNWLYTIVLLWPMKKIFNNILPLIYGQIRLIKWSFAKDYYKLYPRVLWEVMKNFKKLILIRRKYLSR